MGLMQSLEIVCSFFFTFGLAFGYARDTGSHATILSHPFLLSDHVRQDEDHESPTKRIERPANGFQRAGYLSTQLGKWWWI